MKQCDHRQDHCPLELVEQFGPHHDRFTQLLGRPPWPSWQPPGRRTPWGRLETSFWLGSLCSASPRSPGLARCSLPGPLPCNGQHVGLLRPKSFSLDGTFLLVGVLPTTCYDLVINP